MNDFRRSINRMRAMSCVCLGVFVVATDLLTGAARADTPDPPIAESRLTVSSLVREDIFAGWRSNDLERFARGAWKYDGRRYRGTRQNLSSHGSQTTL